MELDLCANFFESKLKQEASPTEIETFNALRNTAQRHIERNSSAFEDALSEMKSNNFSILWRQDWFVLHLFKEAVNTPHRYSDRATYEFLIERGQTCLKNDETDQLRNVVLLLMRIKIYTGAEDDITSSVNIIKS